MSIIVYPIVNIAMSKISSAVMCTLHDFHYSKAKFIHTSTMLLDRLLILETTTRTPRVHLVLKNIHVIIMSEDTPECAKLHNLKIFFFWNMLPNLLAMCSKTRRPQILLKMIPQCLNMELYAIVLG